jgi:transposase
MFHSASIGIDFHANKNEVHAINKNTGEYATATLSGNPDDLIKWIDDQGFEEPLRCVYESGPTGFVLARALIENGIACSVAATSKLPSRKDKKKNDRVDAKYLARMLMSGAITEVWIPSEEEESLRDLSRLRGEVAKDLTRAKQRVTSFLLIKGVKYEKGKKRWTKMFFKWAADYEFVHATDTYVLRDKLAEVLRLQGRLEGVEAEILRIIGEHPKLDEAMRRLMCIHGIGLVTSFSSVAEIGNFRRFKNGSALASYLGLMPSESSTGDKTTHGKVTKQGNSHLRRLLLEAASSYSKPFRALKEDGMDKTVPPLVRTKAVQCSKRLRKRRVHLAKRGKNANKAKCAIARELAEWIYYVAVM